MQRKSQSRSTKVFMHTPLCQHKLSVMKPIHTPWLVGLYDYLQNKPDVIRKGFEMAVTVEAVTKVLDPEDPIQDLVSESLSHIKLQSP